MEKVTAIKKAALNLLEKLKEQNIPLVISDDAHRVEELGFDFDMAEEKLFELKISNRIKF